MFNFFKKNKNEQEPKPTGPSIIGLRIGCSFEVDPLMIKLVEDFYTIEGMASTQIIEAAGVVNLGSAKVFRFYTDDDAFLQVVAEGGAEDHHVVDVKLFHFYDTLDVSSKQNWDSLLSEKVGAPSYELNGQTYQRVWTAEGDFHKPVLMREETTDTEGKVSHTDQFTMLYERPVGTDDEVESLFVSAEEAEDLSRCLVLSTGMTLSPANITIHG